MNPHHHRECSACPDNQPSFSCSCQHVMQCIVLHIVLANDLIGQTAHPRVVGPSSLKPKYQPEVRESHPTRVRHSARPRSPITAPPIVAQQASLGILTRGMPTDAPGAVNYRAACCMPVVSNQKQRLCCIGRVQPMLVGQAGGRASQDLSAVGVRQHVDFCVICMHCCAGMLPCTVS